MIAEPIHTICPVCDEPIEVQVEADTHRARLVNGEMKVPLRTTSDHSCLARMVE